MNLSTIKAYMRLVQCCVIDIDMGLLRREDTDKIPPAAELIY